MTVIIDTRIRSITKTYTGTVLMQLAQRGKLSLDDTIGKYVPGVPNGDKITLRQLADMTSGVASYTQGTTFTDTYFAKPQTVFTPRQLLKVGPSESPLFAPGAKFNYANTNSALLGMAVQNVTGRALEAAYHRLSPMTRASWSAPPRPCASSSPCRRRSVTPSPRPSNIDMEKPS
ncbi:MAG: beta-lactamase family protein [Actinomycetota bacterium]|nr:beta-lactamase family protein [Actinomycetota bacterium]